eukprot:12625250-Alexandrium_andersonii.AAC.1
MQPSVWQRRPDRCRPRGGAIQVDVCDAQDRVAQGRLGGESCTNFCEEQGQSERVGPLILAMSFHAQSWKEPDCHLVTVPHQSHRSRAHENEVL